jgi:uncharacterized protein YqjF (DUF2071 family)
MFMRWHDLLFAHWAVDAARLRGLVPPGLEIETFDGAAWVGVVPFRMSGVRAQWLPPVPGVSAFAELNVRTYVHPASDPSRPGVWFFSLDAASRVAVRAARWSYHLPYMEARMSCRGEGERVVYASRRVGPHVSLAYGEARTARAEFAARYGPAGPAACAAAGSLESFLTDRYCLYAYDRGRVYRADIDHDPWPLRGAEAEIEVNTMLEPLGISAGEVSARPVLHFGARRLDVAAWWPRRVATGDGGGGISGDE